MKKFSILITLVIISACDTNSIDQNEDGEFISFKHKKIDDRGRAFTSNQFNILPLRNEGLLLECKSSERYYQLGFINSNPKNPVPLIFLTDKKNDSYTTAYYLDKRIANPPYDHDVWQGIVKVDNAKPYQYEIIFNYNSRYSNKKEVRRNYKYLLDRANFSISVLEKVEDDYFEDSRSNLNKGICSVSSKNFIEEFINTADAQQNRHIKINTKLEMEQEEIRKRAEKNKI